MLITFESGECGGKDTQIDLLSKRLVKNGYTVNSQFWEPGSTLKAEVIRILLKNKHNSEFKFPGDFIETFDFQKYSFEFSREEVPEIAASHLRDAMKIIKSVMKYDTINFLLKNNFGETETDLQKAIKILNEEKKKGGTPAEWFFRVFYTPEVLVPEAQMHLFMASRNIIYHKPIKDALKKYDFVTINRSGDSTTVYQGHAQDKSLKDKIRELNKEAMEGTVPDITFLLDLPVEEVKKRKALRLEKKRYSGITKDFFDEQEDAFHYKIREGYLEEAAYYNSLPLDSKEYGRIKIINGLGTPEDVHERIWQELSRKLTQ
jgi:thymidylate kinase